MTMKYVWLAVVLMCSVQGCKVGYFGPKCSKTCVYPGYGERCQGKCNCTKELCNIITGCEDCNVGYYGPHCTKLCRYPNFGVQCQEKCDCSEDICNHINGCINIQEGSIYMQTTSNLASECEDGYYGQNCISPCRYPNFGRKCQYECHCNLSKCNHIKGCGNLTGNVTTQRDGVINPNKQNLLKGKQLIITIAGSCVLFVFTLIAITVVVRKFRLHRKRNREPDLDSEFSSFQSSEDIADSTDNIDSVRYCQHDAFRENCGNEIYANSCT